MKVLVTNIPVRGSVNGYVEVPGNLEGVELREAVRLKVRDGLYQQVEAVYAVEVEAEILETGFELESPLWET